MRTSRADLARLLGVVTKAAPSRNTIPILGTVRLVGEGDRLHVTATNLDIEITGSIRAEGEPISACVDARLLAAAVGKAGSNDITFGEEPGHVVVKAGRSRTKLPALRVEDFPTMEYGTVHAEFETNPAELFAPVAFAMSDEATRYYLCGIYLQPTAVTATNGHKLSTVAVDLGADFQPVIVPSFAVNLAPKGNAAVRLAGPSAEQLTKIQFVTPDYTLTSRLIEGTYPDFERVIPSRRDNTAVVDGAALAAAAERVSIVAQDKEPAARLDLTSDEVTIGSTGAGESTDVVPAAYDGPAQAVGFNTRYLVEVLGCFPAGEVRMSVGDCTGPVVFVSDAAPGQTAVLMPRRV